MAARARRFDWSSLLGFDIFISYKQGQASAYARTLFNALSASGFTCFIDEEETVGGGALNPVLERALKRSRTLVVVASPEVLRSAWVQQEVEIFSALRGRTIVPISSGGFLATPDPGAPFATHLKSFAWLEESETTFGRGVASATVVEQIKNAHARRRIRTISKAITAASIAVLAATAGTALWQRSAAVQRQQEAVQQRPVADSERNRADSQAKEANEQRWVAESRFVQLSVDNSSRLMTAWSVKISTAKPIHK